MFCTNCGKKLPDDAKFCNHCGAPQSGSSVNVSQSKQSYTKQSYIPQQPATEKKVSKAGIILLICGILSVIGAFANGSYARMAVLGIDLANIVTLLIQFGLIFGGIRMILKSKKE